LLAPPCSDLPAHANEQHANAAQLHFARRNMVTPSKRDTTLRINVGSSRIRLKPQIEEVSVALTWNVLLAAAQLAS
jgi:hypothetical protein